LLSGRFSWLFASASFDEGEEEKKEHRRLLGHLIVCACQVLIFAQKRMVELAPPSSSRVGGAPLLAAASQALLRVCHIPYSMGSAADEKQLSRTNANVDATHSQMSKKKTKQLKERKKEK
jgi:hypothetical protein